MRDPTSFSNRLWRCMAVFLALWALKAQAGPPFITDDPEPVEYQHWEFYVASQDSKLGGDWSGTAPHFEVNYGAVPDLQLHLIAPLAYDSPPEGAGHYGLGDIELGAKYRFIQETNGWPQVGIFPLLEVPAGSARDNLGNGHSQAFLPLWVQKLRPQFLFRPRQLGFCRGGAAKAGLDQCAHWRGGLSSDRESSRLSQSRHRV